LCARIFLPHVRTSMARQRGRPQDRYSFCTDTLSAVSEDAQGAFLFMMAAGHAHTFACSRKLTSG
jgi:hypothetical protein